MEPPVAAGTLDRRLFNVSKLVEFGYDDRSRQDIPLIVTRTAGTRTTAPDPVAAAGVPVDRHLPSVRGETVRAKKDVAGRLWSALRSAPGVHGLAAGISRVALDGPVRASLDRSVPQVGAPAAWQAGHTGQGATVAVLDTGIDPTHPDLADAVVGSRDFTGSESGATDRAGHGTHVASIITGSGAASGGRYAGVAPDARLLNGKVLGDHGGGLESDVIAGMEWAVAEGADAVNLSLGSSFPSDGTEALDEAVNRLSAASDVLFVVSAGNSGPAQGSIASPGAADAALTVGAVSARDELAEFSSRGPRLGDSAIKPDITAPGVDIVAARADGSDRGTPVDDRYTSLSGTSMAAPHVAGVAAILAGQRPELGGEDLKSILMGTAVPGDGLTVYAQGAGRVDAARAVGQGVYAQPATVSNGIARWPHQDDTPIERTVTYRNVTDAPVTLALAVDVRGPSGAAAPAAMFTMDSSQVTVPARGSAPVRLVTDTSVSAPDGVYGGVLVATGPDGRAVRTPVGVVREVESYDVTMTFLDHDGEPTANYLSTLTDLANPTAHHPYDPSGSVVVRLPKGQYCLSASIQTGSRGEDRFLDTLVSEPTVPVVGDMALTFDAREGKQFGAIVDRPATQRVLTDVGFGRQTAWGGSSEILSGWDMAHLRVRPSATRAPDDEFEFRVRTTLAAPDGSGGVHPYLYNIQWSGYGRVPADLTPRVRDRELAVVHTELAATGADKKVGKDNPLVAFPTPARITEYFTPDIPWHREWVQYGPDDPEWPEAGLYTSTPRTFHLGQRVTERWYAGVFGPAFPVRDTWVGRKENTIAAQPPLFVDQAPDRFGRSRVDGFRATLYRDGQRIGESDDGYFDVPADPATYRLEVESTRSTVELSTRVSSAWTFRSEHVAVEDPKGPASPLPVMAIRFAPKLDDHNRAPAGSRFSFPIYVQRQEGARHGTLTNVTVQASYDDGATWGPVPLSGEGLNRTAHLMHPTGQGFVSLKASATDSAGNGVEQTIIRAYAVE
ncbi:S8 family serine peptidase [Plantactinospora mayteni]|uniref:Serine protease n=1 Tax=Plantactinospora mayteni TaxID=566021 RepID=A0ABQ4EXU3_9ACTN|nr:S8 family peptidase [Plantactinospora mayteni]GIG99432.1 serine protease [Plantactinospora mayteni]